MITFGSACSGIEAASVAWHPLGWQTAWLAEIEPFPAAVLAHHYPFTDNLGDMTTIANRILTGEVEAPDVLVSGTPCQSFSISGLRGGIADDRGQLIFNHVEILNAADTIRRADGRESAIAVWENVPGALSSSDNAFGRFLAGLVGECEPIQPPGEGWPNAGVIAGPQRAAAWRILDAQYFGLAQRRKRLFVVASARNGFNPAEVLFEFGGVQRHIAPSREAGKETAGNVGEGANQTGFRKLTFESYAQDETASTMMARDYKSYTDLVAYGVPGNWIGRKPENGGNSTQFMHELSPAQTATDKHGVATVYPINTMTMLGRPSDDLKPRMGLGIGKESDPQNTLSAAHCHAVATQTAVRRLTPIECERLQGFPDFYTAIPWRGKPAADCPDGHRYKALGNSMAVNVMRWIGERIAEEIKNDKQK